MERVERQEILDADSFGRSRKEESIVLITELNRAAVTLGRYANYEPFVHAGDVSTALASAILRIEQAASYFGLVSSINEDMEGALAEIRRKLEGKGE